MNQFVILLHDRNGGGPRLVTHKPLGFIAAAKAARTMRQMYVEDSFEIVVWSRSLERRFANTQHADVTPEMKGAANQFADYLAAKCGKAFAAGFTATMKLWPKIGGGESSQ